jgi:hypothetical protein
MIILFVLNTYIVVARNLGWWVNPVDELDYRGFTNYEPGTLLKKPD